MSADLDVARRLSAQGQVVEIFEHRGRRLARVRLGPFAVLDVAVSDQCDLHLDDHVVVTGSLEVERVSQDPGGGDRPIGHDRSSEEFRSSSSTRRPSWNADR